MGQQTESNGQRFLALDALRGLAACWVVYFHVLGSMGYLAVDFFLVLSGFILAHRYWYGTKPTSTREFIIHRIARLYPLHLFTLLVFVVVHWLMYWVMPSFPDGSLFTFVQHLTLTHNIGLNPNGLTWNAPSWSISVEFFVNLLFIAFIPVTTRNSTLLVSASAILLLLLHNHGNLNVHHQNDYGFLNTGLLRGLASFMLGLIAYRLYRYCRDRVQITRYATGLEVIATALALAVVWCGYGRPEWLDIFVPYVAVLLITVYALEQGALTRAVQRLAYLGEISYSVYLNHFIVIMVLRHLALQWQLPEGVWIFVATLSITLVCSHFTHFYLEIPWGKALRQRLQRLTTSQPVTV